MKISEVLTQKQAGLHTAEPGMSMQAAVQKMCDYKVGAVLVESAPGEALGILTERDVLRFCATRAAELTSTRVDEVMVTDLIVVTGDTDVEEALSLMTHSRIRHLPIIEDSKIIGMVSIGDLVKSKLEIAAVEAKYLRDYILS